MPHPRDCAIDEMAFQLTLNVGCAVAAHADETDSAVWQPLYCRDADLFGSTAGNHLLLVEGNEQSSAQRACARRAAAMAS